MDKFGECTFQAIDALEAAKRWSAVEDYGEAALELRRAQRELNAAIAIVDERKGRKQF